MRTKNPQPAKPSVPPAIADVQELFTSSLLGRHALHFLSAMEHLNGHWESLACLIPSIAQDKVEEDRITQRFWDLIKDIERYAARLATWPAELDAAYVENLAGLMNSSEYRKADELLEIAQMRRRWWNGYTSEAGK
ncbi:MAG TPA: hypothetical protein VF669_13215 [Tepidisphaeraceae bacterium]|jgi:hypothetical protein